MNKKIWSVFPRLTERIWADHAEAGMLGGHHDPDHAIRVGQMAMEITEDDYTGLLAGVAGLVHNADRILQHKLKLGSRRDAPHEAVGEFVDDQIRIGTSGRLGALLTNAEIRTIIDAVLKHDGRNGDCDSDVLKTLMDADRLVNAEPDLVIRAAQLYHDLPPIDPVHFDKDPTASYHDPKSVLREIMEALEWLTPGTDFYVRLPKARAIAAERKVFFDLFLQNLVNCRMLTGFHPYPPELVAMREKFSVAAATK